MKRFVEHFSYWDRDDVMLDDKINKYAEDNNLKIITIAPLYQSGIYVLFEEECDE